MSLQNDQTIRTYNNAANLYIERDRHVERSRFFEGSFYQHWIDAAFTNIPTNASVLEVGSAYGRDAKYIADKGYTVQVSDASDAFVSVLKRAWPQAMTLNIINEKTDERYDVVFASAVFLHFTKDDFEKALLHVHDSLKEKGKFVFSLIEGEGEKLSDGHMDGPRYFKYWKTGELNAVLARYGLVIKDISKAEFKEKTWLYISATKGIIS